MKKKLEKEKKSKTEENSSVNIFFLNPMRLPI